MLLPIRSTGFDVLEPRVLVVRQIRDSLENVRADGEPTARRLGRAPVAVDGVDAVLREIGVREAEDAERIDAAPRDRSREPVDILAPIEIAVEEILVLAAARHERVEVGDVVGMDANRLRGVPHEENGRGNADASHEAAPRESPGVKGSAAIPARNGSIGMRCRNPMFSDVAIVSER